MKRTIAILLVCVFIITLAPNAWAENGDIKVIVNGKKIQSDVSPMLVENTTMLPFRPILNAIGVKDDQITWREKSQSIEIKTDKKYIFLAIGTKGAVVDSGMQTLNVAPFIAQNRTMIPVRFISEALGATVNWDENTQTVTIKTP